MTEVDDEVGGTGQPGSRVVVMAVTDGSGSAVRVSAQVVPAAGCGASPHFGGGLHGFGGGVSRRTERNQ